MGRRGKEPGPALAGGPREPSRHEASRGSGFAREAALALFWMAGFVALGAGARALAGWA